MCVCVCVSACVRACVCVCKSYVQYLSNRFRELRANKRFANNTRLED